LNRRIIRTYLVVTAGNIIACAFLYWHRPDLHLLLIDEDRALQNITAVTFAVAAAIGLGKWLQTKSRHFLMPLIPLGACIAALDEISFAKTSIVVNLPSLNISMFSMNAVHDVLLLLYIAVVLEKPAYLPAVITVGVMAAIASGIGLRILLKRQGVAVFKLLWLQLLLVGLILAGFAQIIDLDIWEYTWLTFVEELAELNAAIALLFAASATGVPVVESEHQGTTSSDADPAACPQ
jgi:hypothetical protein